MGGLKSQTIESVAVTASGSTTQRLSYAGARGGGFVVTSLSTAASVTYLVSPKRGGTLADLKDSNNAVITQALTAGDAYQIPTEAFGFAEIALLANAGTAVVEFCAKN